MGGTISARTAISVSSSFDTGCREGVGPREGPPIPGEKVWPRIGEKGVVVRDIVAWRKAGDMGPRGWKPFGVGPRDGAGDGLADGFSDSVPDHKNPSKRPDTRISHSETLILDSVAIKL